MNILFICDEYPPGRHGGIGTMVQLLSRELVKQGHAVYVAGLYPYSYQQQDYEEDHGVKVWRLRYGLNIRGAGSGSKIYTALEKLPDFIKARLNGKSAFSRFTTFLSNLIEQEKIDIIEMADWHIFTSFIGFNVQWPRFTVPVVLKSNGSYTYFSQETNTPADPIKVSADQQMFDRADALAAVSRYTAGINEQLFRIERHTQILYNSIEIPELISQGERLPFKVIFTGTLIYKKGIYKLMEAWNLVVKALPQAELFVYGKGKTVPLRQLLDPVALKNVHFKGHVTRKTLNHEFSIATAAIFPSYSECFAFAPMEAMAAGCPVIYTKRSSGSELIKQGENGSLVDPDDINDMAGKIIELLKSKELQQRYSQKGRETVSINFNIQKSARDHVKYYQEVINNHHLNSYE